MIYRVLIDLHQARIVNVEANDEDDALYKAQEMFNDGVIEREYFHDVDIDFNLSEN